MRRGLLIGFERRYGERIVNANKSGKKACVSYRHPIFFSQDCNSQQLAFAFVVEIVRVVRSVVLQDEPLVLQQRGR
jgi:hypothetical protein